MASSNGTLKIYTVVDVMCGVAVGAESFLRIEDARRRLKQIRKGRNLDEDDVQLFETIIVQAPRLSPTTNC